MFKRLNLRKYILIVLMLILAIGVATFNKSNNIVAKVGSVNINKDQFYDSLVEQYGDQTLDGLISEKIIELEVKKENIEVTKDEIDNEYSAMEEEQGGPDVFAQTLSSHNITKDDMTKNIELNLSLEKLLIPEITITDKEIEAFYNENIDMFSTEEQIDASHILVDTKELASEISDKLKAGESFEELALEYSTDDTKEMGGNLGLFGKGEMVESFEDVAFSLPIGEISEPVKSDFGYHIIKVNKKIKAETSNLYDKKEEVKEMVLDSKMTESYNNWYEKKLSEYKIINNLNK